MNKILSLLLLGLTVSACTTKRPDFVSIGGTVVDEAGQPVSGATVFLSGSGINPTSSDAIPTWTDADGHWRYIFVTPGTKNVSLGVRHPRYASRSVSDYDMKVLRSGTLTLKLSAADGQVRQVEKIRNND